MAQTPLVTRPTPYEDSREDHEDEDDDEDESMPSFGLPSGGVRDDEEPMIGRNPRGVERDQPASGPPMTMPFEPSIDSRSPYHLPTSERLRGLANRILFSRYYILFYLVMTGLSLGTVILSLLEGGCPSLTWHILEIIVNGGMVLEVGTRWIGFGKEYPLTPLNILDLVLVLFCVVTLLLVFLNPCGSSSKREEVLDTILLVVRNAVQFLRLGSILRRSGQSVLRPPKPIDLTSARAADFDLDIEDEDAFATTRGTTGGTSGISREGYREVPDGAEGSAGGAAFFDAADELESGTSQKAPARKGVFGKEEGQVGYEAGKANLTEADEEQWDRLG